MKALVIYYSYEGNTRLIAQLIAERTNADIFELQPEKEIKSKGFMKYFWGGKQVVFKEMPKLKPLDVNPLDYDVLFIGTPVWAFTFTPPVRTFFHEYALKERKVALFCTHEGGKKNTLENMREQLKDNEVIGAIDFVKPLQQERNELKNSIKNWLKSLEGLE